MGPIGAPFAVTSWHSITSLSPNSRFDVQIIGISVDGVWSHLAFSKGRKPHIPLLADFEPKGAVAVSMASTTGCLYHPEQLCTPGCVFSPFPWSRKNIRKRGGDQRFWPLASLATAPTPSSSRYPTTRLLHVMIADESSVSKPPKSYHLKIIVSPLDSRRGFWQAMFSYG